ncbi:hypothetical protein ACQ4PT_019365 [Festuca glaucescens]
MAAYSSRSGCYPEILLDQDCRISYCHNSTSATTENSEGLSVDVSFQIRDPPALSLCFVRCNDLTGQQRLCGEHQPSILSVAGGSVLLLIPFCDDGININRCCYMEYFVYRAGPGAPSLRLLPAPYPPSCSMKVAILPICDDGVEEHYAVVFPFVQFVVLDSRHHYTLYIYRSDSKAWCTQVARIAEDMETQNATLKLALHYPTSVVHAGSGLIGWVDLWWGVLLCNVLDENPAIRFVAVPVPEPCKPLTEFFVKFEDQNCAKRPYRQMTVHNGVMKFIELEYHTARFNTKRRDDHGWMATTWTRPISSDVWHEVLTFDTSDISVTDWSSMHLLLPEIFDGEKKLTWEKFISGAPTLSLHDDHIVYIVVKSVWHQTAFVLAVNTRSLTLESGAQCLGEMIASLEPTYVPCALSSYFGMTAFVLP